ncbi:MAG: SDR family oxidoreductase [Candidatus Eremiobacteraeota bacterium]|nr:SDR family oxidoreductase [Candidatus Eremiobacteraeota bacterium]MBV9263641.1 SDR family oxidoreductase [Candidatus Eremiobacteraeota bacterium]
MDLGIRGRTALVLGASAGIGEAVALALAREGAGLVLAARRVDRLQSVARRATELGASVARAVGIDLADERSIEASLEVLQRDFGPIDIVVLNGGGPVPGKFGEIPIGRWDDAYRLLLRSMLQLIAALVPGMRSRGWGRIVALTSTSVKQPIDTLVLSNAFRTALVAALRTLASEAAKDGVTVNCIATGRVDTARLRSLYEGDEAKLREAAAEVPIGRIASPSEYAPLVAFLCGEPARYINGQTISIDGGLVRGLFG